MQAEAGRQQKERERERQTDRQTDLVFIDARLKRKKEKRKNMTRQLSQ